MSKQGPKNKKRKTRQFFGLFKYDPDAVLSGGNTRLQHAILLADLSFMQKLINEGADIEYAGTRSAEDRPLAMAIRKYSTGAAELLLRNGANPNHVYNGCTYLSLATAMGSAHMVRSLLAHKTDVKARDLWTQHTALFHVRDMDHCICDMLLKAGVDINAKNHKGYTALYNALVQEQYALFEHLLYNKADPNITPDDAPHMVSLILENVKHKDDPLWSALKKVIKAGASADETCSTGTSIFMKAVQFKDMNMMKLAVSHCKNLQSRDADGNTPLHFALKQKDKKLIHQVLDIYQKCPMEKNNDGVNVISALLSFDFAGDYYLTGQHDVNDIIERMLKMGGNPDVTFAAGRTLLHKVVMYYNHDLLKLVLSHQPNVNAADENGQTPLLDAVFRAQDLDMVDMLLDAGADPDAVDEKGWTLLDRMAREGDRTSPIVQRIIAAGGQYRKQLPSNDHAQNDQKKVKRHIGDNKNNNTGPDQGFKKRPSDPFGRNNK